MYEMQVEMNDLIQIKPIQLPVRVVKLTTAWTVWMPAYFCV